MVWLCAYLAVTVIGIVGTFVAARYTRAQRAPVNASWAASVVALAIVWPCTLGLLSLEAVVWWINRGARRSK